MNPVSRDIMNIYYHVASTAMHICGGNRTQILRFARILGCLRTWIGYIGPKKSRRIFMEHIHDAFPDLNESACRSILTEFWFYHQLRFLDLFFVAQSSHATLGDYLRFENLSHVDSALADTHGAIVTTLHLGDPRICHVALGHRGYDLHLLSARYDDYAPRARTARLDASRKYHRVSFLDKSLRWIYRDLQSEKLVFMAISGYGGDKGIPASFLSKELVFSSAPVRIARITGRPIIPAVDIVGPQGVHTLKLFPPLPAPSHSSEDAIISRELVQIFETETRLYPSQLDWIWYVIRSQEHAGEVAAYEEGRILRSRESEITP